MENLWYNKHRNNYAYSLSSSYKSKYNKKEKSNMIIYSDEKQIFNNVKNEWYDTKKIPCFKYCSKIYARKEE